MSDPLSQALDAVDQPFEGSEFDLDVDVSKDADSSDKEQRRDERDQQEKAEDSSSPDDASGEALHVIGGATAVQDAQPAPEATSPSSEEADTNPHSPDSDPPTEASNSAVEPLQASSPLRLHNGSVPGADPSAESTAHVSSFHQLKRELSMCASPTEFYEFHTSAPDFFQRLKEMASHERDELMMLFRQKEKQFAEKFVRATTSGVFDEEEDDGSLDAIFKPQHNLAQSTSAQSVVADQPHLMTSLASVSAGPSTPSRSTSRDDAASTSAQQRQGTYALDASEEEEGGFVMVSPPAPTLSQQWRRLFDRPHFIDSLRHHAFAGTLHVSPFRSVAWRYLLGTMSPDNWREDLKRTRDKYEQLRDNAVVDPRGQDPEKDHPLNGITDSAWLQHFHDERLREDIRRDVDRTFPEVTYFSVPAVRDVLVDILFVYAKTHPDVLYRQGMHELLAPCLLLLQLDTQLFHDEAAKHGEEEQPSSEEDRQTVKDMSTVLDEAFLAHDAYAMFDAIMQVMKPFYSSEGADSVHDETQTHLQQRLHHIQSTVLAGVDEQLSSRLTELGIPPMIYGIRWTRLLFTRELPLHDALCVWDALFASRTDDNSDFELLDYVCVALLLYVRSRLIKGDYTACLSTLMRFPDGIDPQPLLAKALHLKQPMNFPDPSNWKLPDDGDEDDSMMSSQMRLGSRGFELPPHYEDAYQHITRDAPAEEEQEQFPSREETGGSKPIAATGRRIWQRRHHELEQQLRALHRRNLLMADALDLQLMLLRRAAGSAPAASGFDSETVSASLNVLTEIRDVLMNRVDPHAIGWTGMPGLDETGDEFHPYTSRTGSGTAVAVDKAPASMAATAASWLSSMTGVNLGVEAGPQHGASSPQTRAGGVAGKPSATRQQTSKSSRPQTANSSAARSQQQQRTKASSSSSLSGSAGGRQQQQQQQQHRRPGQTKAPPDQELNQFGKTITRQFTAYTDPYMFDEADDAEMLCTPQAQQLLVTQQEKKRRRRKKRPNSSHSTDTSASDASAEPAEAAETVDTISAEAERQKIFKAMQRLIDEDEETTESSLNSQDTAAGPPVHHSAAAVSEA